ncbi:hypothetical protein MVEN_00455700 [Mycena venus]|uniref:Uncharacterized protein n=1 Tax=Mycena venus TaxID=2733690 RepID=A0A8H7DBQ6_9AGAR|nr:hypothetical protein MVEN_00455700 [Mycena venus]
MSVLGTTRLTPGHRHRHITFPHFSDFTITRKKCRSSFTQHAVSAEKANPIAAEQTTNANEDAGAAEEPKEENGAQEEAEDSSTSPTIPFTTCLSTSLTNGTRPMQHVALPRGLCHARALRQAAVNLTLILPSSLLPHVSRSPLCSGPVLNPPSQTDYQIRIFQINIYNLPSPSAACREPLSINFNFALFKHQRYFSNDSNAVSLPSGYVGRVLVWIARRLPRASDRG